MAGRDGNGLISYVHVPDESGVPQAFGPEDTLPDWAIDKIGAHCFEGGKKPKKSRTQKAKDDEGSDGDGSGGASEAPAKSASKDEWVAYAVSQGMSEDDANAATKDDLIEKFKKD